MARPRRSSSGVAEQITIRLSPAAIEALDERVIATGRTRSEVIEGWLLGDETPVQESLLGVVEMHSDAGLVAEVAARIDCDHAWVRSVGASGLAKWTCTRCGEITLQKPA